jgi:STE24 endopeptidase
LDPWNPDTYNKRRVNEDRGSRYQRLRRRTDVLSTLASAAVLGALLATGAHLRLREVGSIVGAIIGNGWEEQGTVVGVALALFLLLQIVELPFAFQQGYRLEHRYGLSTERFGSWLIDHAKGAAVSAAFAIAGASLVYWTIRVAPTWWWVLSAAVAIVALIGLLQLAPVVLLPLFYSFKPLDRPALVARLLALAEKARTRVVGVYEWALSSHTRKANAALTGLGRTRRILLSDTLLASYTDDEIEVVLAHELSHHVHHDLWRGVALQSVLIMAAFFLAFVTLNAAAAPLRLAGNDDPAGLPLLLLVAGACSVVWLPAANALSRSHERRADRYALELTGQRDAFISAMKRLAQQNLAEDRPSAVVRWYFYSHPPIRERVDAARAWRAGAAAGGQADVA